MTLLSCTYCGRPMGIVGGSSAYCLNRDCPGKFNRKRSDYYIESFDGDFRFLSNFWIASISYEGKVYPTVEHAYQCMKTLDEEERKRVFAAATPGKAKRLGKDVTKRPDWEEVRIGIMRELVRAKFTQHPVLAEKLIATGKKWLVEGNNWNDKFWGVCDGEGENWLGVILMDVRSELSLQK